MRRIAVFILALACPRCSDPMRQAEPAPHVVSSVPQLDEPNVYPSPLLRGNGEEFVLELAFSEAMREHDAFELVAQDHARSAVPEWSEDRTALTLFVRPSLTAPQPLADDTEYSLDLSSLESAAGAALDPDVRLRAGHVSFRTGHHDRLLNHACGHTLFGPFASVAASESPDASAPDIGTTHTEYSIALPENETGSFAGFVRARIPMTGSYRLFFDGDTTVSSRDSAETRGEPAPLTPTPEACPGITHELTLATADAGDELFLHIGPQPTTTRRIIVELVL
jgi:hypothetical protein